MKNVAEAIRTKVEKAEPGAFFTASDFPGSRRAVESALSRLAAHDRLMRVRHGVYWKGVNSRFGMGRPKPEEVAVHVAGGRGVGPTGWTASNALGLSTQVPPVPELVAVGIPPTGVPDIVFHSRWNFARIDLNYLEIAVLELLRNWPNYVEANWSESVEKITQLHEDRAINLHRVFSVASREKSLTLRSRITDLKAATLSRTLHHEYPDVKMENAATAR